MPLLLSFVATPIIVHALGNEDYGIYALVLGFVSYSFTFGIGRAITKYLAEYRSKGDAETAEMLVSATFTLNLLVGVIGAAVVFLSSDFLISNLFNIDAKFVETARIAFYLAAMIIFMTMMNQVASSVLQGAQRFDVYSKLFNLNSFGILIGNVVLALMGFGLLALLGWNLFVLTLSTLIGLYFASRLVPEFKLRLNFKQRWIKQVLGFSAWIIGYQILGNILLLFERGWIMRKLGAEELTYYVVPMTIGLYIHSSVASLLLVVFPVASEYSGNKRKLLSLYKKATKITLVFVFFVLASLITLSSEFLTLWMGNEFAVESTTLLILHTVTFSSAAVLVIAWQMADGLGYPSYNFAVFSVCLCRYLVGDDFSD